MAQTDFLASKRNEIRKRLAEIRPLHEEYLQLEKAEAALESVGRTVKRAVTRRGPGRPRATAKRKPGRPRATAKRKPGRPRAAAKRGPGRPRATAKRKPGRPRTRGRAAGKAAPITRRRGKTRADQAVDLVKKNPGITVSEMAKKMGIRQNYLYRVMGNLQEQGSIRRRNKGFHPK